jgi:hypothetical protein
MGLPVVVKRIARVAAGSQWSRAARSADGSGAPPSTTDKEVEMSDKDLGNVTITRCQSEKGFYYIASVRVGPKGRFGSIAVVPGNYDSEEEARLAALDLYRSRVALIGEEGQDDE